jgi:hypothetical protein
MTAEKLKKYVIKEAASLAVLMVIGDLDRKLVNDTVENTGDVASRRLAIVIFDWIENRRLEAL